MQRSRRVFWHSPGGIPSCPRLTPTIHHAMLTSMSPDEQTDALTHEILNLISRWVRDWDAITIETVIGVLRFIEKDLVEGSEVEFDGEFPIDD